MFLICEETVGLDDIRVVQEGLDLELSNELNQKVVLDDFAFVHDLQGDDHAGTEFPCEADWAELALAESADDLEVLAT